MTGGAIGAICIGATLRIARGLCCIRRRRLIAESIGFRPRPDPSYERVDLFFGEHSACTLCKSRHRRAGNSVGGDAANHGVVCNCEKDRIRQSNGSSALAVHTVAACTVLSVERIEIDDFARWHDRSQLRSMGAGKTAAGATSHERNEGCDNDENRSMLHCRLLSPFFSSIAPGTSIPARTPSGSNCQVRTRTCRETMMPATIPNPI